MLSNNQKKQLAAFKEAKEIAFTMPFGSYRRAFGTNYCGYKSHDNKFYVIGDTSADIQNPDCFIGGKPARQVFDGFTLMSK
jgi:hypothetical protein